MTSYDFLSKYEKDIIKLNSLESQLEELKEGVDLIKGGLKKGDLMAQFRGKGGEITNIPESHYLKMEYLTSEIMRIRINAENNRLGILFMINKLHSKTQKQILKDRYIYLLPWKDIARSRELKDVELYEIHQEALMLLENYLI